MTVWAGNFEATPPTFDVICDSRSTIIDHKYHSKPPCGQHFLTPKPFNSKDECESLKLSRSSGSQ